MLETLITSKTRLKLLLRFFLNSGTSSYLRNLESEFGESTNAIRLELNRFEKAGLLISDKEQNRKVYKANKKHPLFPDIQNIIKKYVGFDQIILSVVEKLGNIHKAYIAGDLAQGIDTKKIDLFLIGDNIDQEYLEHLSLLTADLINRKINYKILNPSEEARFLEKYPGAFLIWTGVDSGK
ncbi:MAG: ArsR family transcriptional regulator [Syntrophothermus sp.]